MWNTDWQTYMITKAFHLENCGLKFTLVSPVSIFIMKLVWQTFWQKHSLTHFAVMHSTLNDVSVAYDYSSTLSQNLSILYWNVLFCTCFGKIQGSCYRKEDLFELQGWRKALYPPLTSFIADDVLQGLGVQWPLLSFRCSSSVSSLWTHLPGQLLSRSPRSRSSLVGYLCAFHFES